MIHETALSSLPKIIQFNLIVISNDYLIEMINFNLNFNRF